MALQFDHSSNNRTRAYSFNMTALIDIVFLLIIFFLVVCRFVEAENFPVTVPQGCDGAERMPQSGQQVLPLAIMPGSEDQVICAVGSEKLSYSPAEDPSKLIERLSALIDARLENHRPDQRIVFLRIDRDVYFRQAQYILAALAHSTATDVQLGVLKDNPPPIPPPEAQKQ